MGPVFTFVTPVNLSTISQSSSNVMRGIQPVVDPTNRAASCRRARWSRSLSTGITLMAMSPAEALAHTELRKACRDCDIDKVKEILSKKHIDVNWLDPKTGGSGAIHLAAHSTNPAAAEVVQVLIDFGANVDLMNDAGNSPLQFAAIKDNTKVARVLLKNGCDFHHVSKDKADAEDYAREFASESMVEFFEAYKEAMLTKGTQIFLRWLDDNNI